MMAEHEEEWLDRIEKCARQNFAIGSPAILALVAAARERADLRRVALEVAQQIRENVDAHGFWAAPRREAEEIAARLRAACGEE